VTVAVDEITATASSSRPVRERVDRLLTELIAIAPAGRAEALQARVGHAPQLQR
jgi:hypothetical protein